MSEQPTFGLIIEVTCPQHRQDDVVAALQAHLDCRLDLAGGRLLLTCYVQAPSPEVAGAKVVAVLAESAPDLVPLRLDDDLVAASDIAARLGISRQAVTQFAQPSVGFPVPVGTCASARVWRWAEVNEWLRENRRDRADEEYWVLQDAAAVINVMILQYRRQGAATLMSVPESITLAADADSRAG